MLYDLTADAYKAMKRTNQEDRFREVARQRLVREALAGRQQRHANPVPSLVDWVQKLAQREPGVRPKPES